MKSNGVPNLTRRLEPLIQRAFPKVAPIVAGILQSSGGCTSDEVRQRLNAVGRQYLGQLQVDTINIRLMLDDDDNLEYWYMNFTGKVLPFWEQHL